MRKIFFIFLAVAASTSTLFAQQTKQDKKDERRKKINAMIKEEEEGVIAYRKHTIFGLKLTSDGYGAFLEIGKAQSINKSLLFQLDISERKHPKENKVTDPQYPGPAVIFGKINFVYPIKIGVQQQILLGNKSNKNGVSVTANYGGGISLSLLRPYFIELYDTTKSPYQRKDIRYESKDSVTFADNSQLYYLQATGPGFTKGWSSLSVNPGLYAKKIAQLVYTKPRQYFVSAYVSILFGKRK